MMYINRGELCPPPPWGEQGLRPKKRGGGQGLSTSKGGNMRGEQGLSTSKRGGQGLPDPYLHHWSWDDIGALEKLREELNLTIREAILSSLVLTRFNLEHCLYSPSGSFRKRKGNTKSGTRLQNVFSDCTTYCPSGTFRTSWYLCTLWHTVLLQD